ncbi:MAG TPA: hypothetical protein V6D43_13745, partial [Candidatus Sericytochromatia bacterium]
MPGGTTKANSSRRRGNSNGSRYGCRD